MREEPSAPRPGPEPESASTEALERFLQRHKGVVGLSKSEHFNQTVLAVALRDPWAGGLARSLAAQPGGDDSAPGLAMFLRGAKNALALVLTAVRKTLFSSFGQEALTLFDALGEKAPAVSGPFGRSFWPHLARTLRYKRRDVVEAAVMLETVLPCFSELRSAVAGSVTPGKDEVESGTVSFGFKRERERMDILRLLNTEYALPHEEEQREIDHSVADYAEARERLLSLFQQRHPAMGRVRDLVSRAVAADHPKKGETVTEKRKRAAKHFSSVVDLSCESATDFDLSARKRTPDKDCPEAETEFRAAHAEVVGYVRGVLAAVEAVLLGEIKALAEALDAAKPYEESVLAGPFGAAVFARFIENMVLTSVLDGMEARLRRLFQDLRNEGVVKELGESSLHVGVKGPALQVQVSLLLTRHGPYMRKTNALIALNPALEGELARCASLVEPLVHVLSLWQKKDPSAVVRLAGDTGLARRLGEIIHLDYAFKSLLLSEPTFLSFVLGNLRGEGFLGLLRHLAAANPKIRRLAVADPRILRAVWLVEKKYPDIGFAAAILSRPMELQGLADSLNQPDGVSVFLKTFIAALRQEGAAAAT